MEKTVIEVTGMDCRHCEERIEKTLAQLDGVVHARASHESRSVEILLDPSRTSVAAARQRIEQAGFGVAP